MGHGNGFALISVPATTSRLGAEPPTKQPEVAVVWLRDDLRIADNPSLSAGIERGGTVIALFVLDEESPSIRPLGGATKWWLHESLLSLERSLADLGVPLVLRRGPAAAIVSQIVAETRAAAVFWNRRYGAAEIAIDTALKSELRADGIHVESFHASLLFEPWTISTGKGAPYSVFTPFWRACRNGAEPRAPLPVPAAAAGPRTIIDSDNLTEWELQPTNPNWAEGLNATWAPGEASAFERLREFLAEDLEHYAVGRDFPERTVTSRLSPHLRWGELSAHQVWHEVAKVRTGLSPKSAEGVTRFLTEIGWREFAWHVLFHFPDLAQSNWRAEFDHFPWPETDPRQLHAWQHGRTGVPLVDAGMRELWNTGTMHNRVRMIVASFLTKNLMIDWRAGEQWFWDTLVDADAASNPFNWQWVAGSGADAAPYFRVFNPELQAKKFDPQGTYRRRHLPEWGSADYPPPIVDLAETRREALSTYRITAVALSQQVTPQ